MMRYYYILLLLFCCIPVKSASACLSEILEPAESVKAFLAIEDRNSLTYEAHSIVMAYERDLEYYNHLSAERCWIFGLSKEQKEIRENIRQLILKKWTFEPDYLKVNKSIEKGE